MSNHREVIVFDHAAGKVYEADALAMWMPPRSEQTRNRRPLRGPWRYRSGDSSDIVCFFEWRRHKAERLAASLNATATVTHWSVYRAGRWFGYLVALDR